MQDKFLFILYCPFRAWFRYTRRPHFSELSIFGELLVVEDPLVIFSKKSLLKPISTIKNYFKYSRKTRLDDRSGAIIIRPVIMFSVSFKKNFKLLGFIDRFLLNAQLPIEEKTKKIEILTERNQEWLISKDNNSFYLLDINDDWSMINYVEKVRKPIEEHIKSVIAKTDLTTVVTKKLKQKYNCDEKVFFLSNGVDVKHYLPNFEKSMQRQKEISVDNLYNKDYLSKEKNDPRLYRTKLDVMKQYNKPIVGSYSGLSGNWSDFKFMTEVEKLLPRNITMVSSGNIHPPTHPDFQEEYKEYLKNQRMNYLKYVDYSLLPEFLEFLDVGIVMHRMDEFNKHSAPNKIWAYLAMGLPVVSTDFLNDEDKAIYQGLVNFCSTPVEYVNAIVNEINNDSLEKRVARRNLAIKYSTENRASRLFSLIKLKYTY